MINGVLNVWKEAGFTSHDVVAKLRGILHQKKNRPHRNPRPGCDGRASGLPWKGNASLRYADR